MMTFGGADAGGTDDDDALALEVAEPGRPS
jgi:hypothetical protein